MSDRVTIADRSEPVPPLVLTADDALKLGARLIVKATQAQEGAK